MSKDLLSSGSTEKPADWSATILYVDTEVVWRGGQEQLLGLMTGMKRRGHEVWLATPPGSPLEDRSTRSDIRTVPFVQGTEMSFLAFFRFRSILDAVRPQILHFNTPKPITAGSIAARLAKVPVIVSSRRVNFPLKTRLSSLKYNLLLDKVFTVSDSIRNTLIQAGVRQELVTTIYEGVDLHWFDNLSSTLLRPAKELPTIGIVAHLSPEKGHSILLEAVRILLHRGIRFHLLIVGDGQLRETLEAQSEQSGVSRATTFLGFRDDSEATMKQFDLFCLPSLSEGLSSAILAAMASSLPVVSTNVGGIPELVADGETGFLVPPGEPVLLADALERLLTDEVLRARMGGMGRSRVETHFTLSQKLLKTETAYRRLLGEGAFR